MFFPFLLAIPEFAPAGNTLVKPSVGVHFTPLPDSIVPSAGTVPITLLVSLPHYDRFQIRNPCDESAHIPARSFRTKRRSKDSNRRPKRPNHPSPSYNSFSSLHVYTNEDFCNSAPMQSIFDDIQLFKAKQDLVYDKEQHLIMMLHSFRPRYNSRRSIGWLDWIGDGLSWLFGTVSQKDLRRLHSHFRTLHFNATDASHERQILRDSITNLASRVDERMANLVTLINRTALHTQQITRALREQQQQMLETQRHIAKDLQLVINAEYLLDLSLHYLRAHMALDRHSDHLDAWLRSLVDISLGRLPHHIVSEFDLYTALERANRYVSTIAPALRVPLDPALISRLYSLRSTRMSVLEDVAVFIIQAPVVLTGPPFDVYRIDVFPAPIHASDGQAQKGYSLIDSLPAFFGLSKDGAKFVHLSDTQYTHCLTVEHGFCTMINGIRSIASPSCAYAIFDDFSYEDLRPHCRFNLHQTPLPSRTIRITDAYFLFLNLTEIISIQCQTNVTFVHPSPSVYVHLPCGCLLKGEFFSTQPAISSCHDSTNVTQYHTINYPLLAVFDLHDSLPNQPTHSFATSPPDISLPDVSKLFDWTRSHPNQSLRAESLRFSQVRHAIKDAYAPPEDLLPPIEDFPSSSSPVTTYTSWPFITASVLFLVLFILVTILWIKFKTLHGLLLAQAIPHPVAHAYRIAASTIIPDDPSPLDLLSERILAFLHHPLVRIFLFLLFVVLCLTILYHLFAFFRWFSAQCFSPIFACPLFCPPESGSTSLHFYLTFNSLVIYVDSIRFEPSQSLIRSHPIAGSASFSFCPWPRLTVNWSEPLQYTLHNLDHVSTFPTIFTVPLPKAWQVATAIRRNNRRYLLYSIGSSPTYHILPWIDEEPFDPCRPVGSFTPSPRPHTRSYQFRRLPMSIVPSPPESSLDTPIPSLIPSAPPAFGDVDVAVDTVSV